ncbi:MAG: four helix bundle protein [Chloroflexota bacterium]
MSQLNSIKDSIVYKKANNLSLAIVALTNGLPCDEVCQLRDRLRETAESIPANIEVGFRKINRIDRIRSLIATRTSLEECRDYLCLAEKLKYASTISLINELEEVAALLTNDFVSSPAA